MKKSIQHIQCQKPGGIDITLALPTSCPKRTCAFHSSSYPTNASLNPLVFLHFHTREVAASGNIFSAPFHNVTLIVKWSMKPSGTNVPPSPNGVHSSPETFKIPTLHTATPLPSRLQSLSAPLRSCPAAPPEAIAGSALDLQWPLSVAVDTGEG